MNHWRVICSLLALAVVVLAAPGLAQANGLSLPDQPQAPLGTGFTYQGYLTDGEGPADGAYDFQFSLYSVEDGGSPLGTLTLGDQAVTGGYFTVLLDFGAGMFDGNARWLAISVRGGAETGAYTPLEPRQALSAAPYAMYAPSAGAASTAAYAATSPWSGITGLPGGFDDDLDNDTTYTAGSGLSLADTTFSLNFGGTGASTTASRSDHTHAADWSITGNDRTSSATNFIGTTDNVALVFRVNDLQALRLEPNDTSPNLIGGYSGNSVVAGVYGVTIGGGGSSSNPNQVMNNFGVVGGGSGNIISGTYSTIGGGMDNDVGGSYSTVGGGLANTANGYQSTVSGGSGSEASGYQATVGGGFFNHATSNYATVGGGYSNYANGYGATVSGGYANFATGGLATVSGGESNSAIGDSATVSGGYNNYANEDHATVSGGRYNTASGINSTVGGGYNNTAAGDYSFVVGRSASNDNAAHDGVFLFADSNNADFLSVAANEFAVRASGGIRLRTSSDLSTGCSLSAGSGTWDCTSDRNAKANFAAVDSGAVLEAVVALPISTWNYKAQEPSVQHIGPVAQDFYAAFKLGEGDTTISMVDADGVALAAIQGLNEIVEEKDAEIAALEVRVAALEMSGSPLFTSLLAPVFGLLGVLAGVWISRKKGGTQ